jgi:hypothetical protein
MNSLEYEGTFSRIARDTILQAAGNYEAPQYWSQRQKIGEDMKKELNSELMRAHSICEHL